MDALVEIDSVVLDKKQKFANGHQTKLIEHSARMSR